jgi:RND family efflux transporter MFP subunit
MKSYRNRLADPAFWSRGYARVPVVLGIVAFVLIAYGVMARHSANARLQQYTQEQAVLPVQVVQPTTAGGDFDLVLPGNVQALYEAPIYARTDGYLKRWLVDIGTPVKAGQLLAEIEAPEVDQQLRAAEAELANAEASQRIATITAERWRDLRDTDSVSQQEADEKISSAAVSDAAVRAAQANLQRLREMSRFEKIVAPFDGVITARNTDVGALINSGSSAGAELFRIADMSSLRLYVRVPQNYAAATQVGLSAEVRFPDRPGATYAAKLERTSGAIDAATRTLLAQLTVDNAKGELLPGAYAEVHFKVPQNADASLVRIPANTLLFRGDGLHVATFVDGKVVMKPVTLGRDFGTEVEVVSGLSARDQVILSPPDSITNDTHVRIATESPEAKAES